MAITASSRAQTRLRASTQLQGSEILEIVKHATTSARGGGASLLTSGIANAGARVHLEREAPDHLALSITSGKRLVELCTFAARVAGGSGLTVLTVGGLETYKTSQPRVAGFIPSGPKSILGYDLYKRFLSSVSDAIQSADASAEVSIAAPEA
jgi:hypothetical protein